MSVLTFPDPFSDAVVDELRSILAQGEVKDLTTALDAQINSQVIPEWYRSNSISRVYAILYSLSITTEDRSQKAKVVALLQHMKEKYGGQLSPD